jgi:hypothetical protein
MKTVKLQFAKRYPPFFGLFGLFAALIGIPMEILVTDLYNALHPCGLFHCIWFI